MPAPPIKAARCRLRRNVDLELLRRHTPPDQLATTDWILYRQDANPYTPRTPKFQAYDTGYRYARHRWPSPPVPRLPSSLTRP